MVFSTNVGIGTEQQEDRYRYRYLYSSNSLYTNGLCTGFLCYPVALAYCSLCNKCYMLQEAIQLQAILVFVAGKLITVFTNEAVIRVPL